MSICVFFEKAFKTPRKVLQVEKIFIFGFMGMMLLVVGLIFYKLIAE